MRARKVVWNPPVKSTVMNCGFSHVQPEHCGHRLTLGLGFVHHQRCCLSCARTMQAPLRRRVSIFISWFSRNLVMILNARGSLADNGGTLPIRPPNRHSTFPLFHLAPSLSSEGACPLGNSNRRGLGQREVAVEFSSYLGRVLIGHPPPTVGCFYNLRL